MSDAPLVSIVLVTWNGAETLPALFAAIARQRVDFQFEIVAVDSGSTDTTPVLLEQSATRWLQIRPEFFGHGDTRNLAIANARGELVVLIVQDAIPVGDDWLARLTAPLRADRYVAGAFCRQCPNLHASALTSLYLGRWTASSEVPRSVRLANPGALDRLEPLAQLDQCAFDNVCSCIRRSVWEQVPFADTPIAEDLEWARAVLQLGLRLEFVPGAVVRHSHERTVWYELQRTYLLHRRLFELFGVHTIPTLQDLRNAIASSVRLHIQCERDAFRTGRGTVGMSRALGLAVAWPLGQYLGALSAARRWRPIRFRGV